MIPPRPSSQPQRRDASPMASFTLGLKVVLPLLIVTALMMTGLRVNSVFETLEKGTLFATAAPVQAATAEAAPAQAAPAQAAPAQAAQAQAAPAKASDEKTAAADEDEEDKPPATGAEREILNNLATRRQEIEARAKALDTREALIKVAEQRVDQKVKEMETLRSQVQALINQASGAQQAQIENLVKIYETMKPKEAAKIFEALDMSVLLGVVQKMKPQRVAVIMAEMAPEKAKEITVALTKQDQLPQMK